jgi:hypothetical protein
MELVDRLVLLCRWLWDKLMGVLRLFRVNWLYGWLNYEIDRLFFFRIDVEIGSNN